MFEPRHHKLASTATFVRRLLFSLAFVIMLSAVALSIGVLGYHYLGQLGWIDALLNGVMAILLAPVVHRGLHLFHLDEKDLDDSPPKR